MSYAREDAAVVMRLADGLRAEGIDVWIDVQSLNVGESWKGEITAALERVDALIAVVSSASVQSHWIGDELVAFARGSERLLIPVRLDETPWQSVPALLQERQAVVLRPGAEDTVAREIGEAVRRSLRTHEPLTSDTRQAAEDLARDLVRGIPGSQTERSDERSSQTRNAVFVVHGHDEQLLAEVDSFLRGVGVEPVLLNRIDEPARSLFTKFVDVANDAQFAVVLMSADDRGASRRQYDHPQVGERALQFRARQNVLLELGFFYGRLSFENVVVLAKPPDQPFPNFERPSDLDGVIFTEIDAASRWQETLTERLAQAGFTLPV